jgi:hypothetical protein
VNDYKDMLAELGITEEWIQEEMLRVPIIQFPSKNVWLAPSEIHGVGIFIGKLKKGQKLTATFGNIKTIVGRYTNHSSWPNAYMQKIGGEIFIVALRDITNEELTIDYRYGIKEILYERAANTEKNT